MVSCMCSGLPGLLGESEGIDDFAFKFAKWLSRLPGNAERLLEESSHMGRPIVLGTLEPRETVVARGVATDVRAFVGGKALCCIRHYAEKRHGFGMWRLV